MYKRMRDETIKVDGKIRTLGYIKRDYDLALIPMTDENPDYIQYLKDVKDGANVTDYDYEAEDARQLAASQTTEEKLYEEAIKKKEKEILRKQAIAELEKE